MKVLITGAAGFIGSQLARTCLQRGDEVIGIDSLTPYYPIAFKRDNLAALSEFDWRFIEADLLSFALENLVEDVEVIFHLAAQPGVRSSWGQTFNAYVDSNVTAMQCLLEATRSARSLQRFVFASSSSVYGDAETFPTHEGTPLKPISPYGATKALGEHLCRVYARSFGLPYVALRYFTVYGPQQRPDMAFHKLIDAALNGREIVIYGDGEQTRDFTFVQDAVDGTVAAGLRGTPGTVYNLGGGERTSMNEVLRMIGDLTGQSLQVRYAAAQDGDARDTAADTDAAQRELGFQPSTSLYDGLREQIKRQRGVRGLTNAAVGAHAGTPRASA